MITKEAIELLQAQAVALANVPPRINSNGEGIPEGIPYLVLPDGVHARSIEEYQEIPARFRGVFKTRRIADFVGYLKANTFASDNAEPGIFIDPDEIKATAIFDLGMEGAPGWGQHRAELKPKETPAYAALLARATTEARTHEFTQIAFIDFISDWEDELRFFDNDEMHMTQSAVLKAVRSISVHAKQGADTTVDAYKHERSTMEAIDIKAKDGLALPAGFSFTCRPYEEFASYSFECKLRAVVDTARNTAKLFYRITALDAVKLGIADEFLTKIGTGLRERSLGDLAENSRIGTFST